MKLTTLSCPRRAVPFSTRLVVLFGGTLDLGWFFIVLGLFFWTEGLKADYSSLFIFRGKLEAASGVVTSVEKSGWTINSTEGPSGDPIYAYHYKFRFGGTDYEGDSYSTESLRAGVAKTVEFPAGRPNLSRICGMDRAPCPGPLGALVFIFVAVGFGMVLPGILKGSRNIRLLAYGELVQRRLISFYEPQNPSRSVRLDSLPGKQGLTKNGEFLKYSFRSVVRAVIWPMVAFAFVVGRFWLKLPWI